MVAATIEQMYRAYYTQSNPILSYMLRKLSVVPTMRVLEPSAGEGVFVDALNKQATNLLIDVYELNSQTISILRKKYAFNSNIKIIQSDTLTDEDLILYSNAGGIYDRIIGNPPYGGWQDLDKRKQLKKLYSGLYVRETYALFLYRCVQLLRNEGILVFIIPDTFLNLHRHTALRNYLLTNTKIREIALFPSSFFPGVNFGYANLSIITLEKASSRQECLNNRFKVITGFRDVQELLDTNSLHFKEYEFIQNEVYTNSNHALFVSQSPVVACINACSCTIADIADCVTGFYSGDDKKHLRYGSIPPKNRAKYPFLDEDLLCTDYETKSNLLNGINGSKCFIPIVKGGSTKFLKPDNWYMDWSSVAVENYKVNKKARFQNPAYYFKNGIAIPMVSSSQITASLIEGRLFDQSIVGVFPKNSKWLYYLLAFFNSPTCNNIIRTINPSANNSANYIKKIPFIVPSDALLHRLDTMVRGIVQALKAGQNYNQDDEAQINHLIKELYGF